jgi:hypothetical protein
MGRSSLGDPEMILIKEQWRGKKLLKQRRPVAADER